MLRLIHKVLPIIIRFYRFYGLRLYIPEAIFNPVTSLSTGLILNYLKELKVEGDVADLGCGSGVIAIYIAKRFSKYVYCIEVSTRSLAVARVNSSLNNVSELVKTLEVGDVGRVKNVKLVVTNPPYLPLEPLDLLDINWCGGRDLRYVYAIMNTGIKLLAEDGSILFTLSSLSDVSEVVRYLIRRGLKVLPVTYVRTFFDIIYLLHAVKVKTHKP